MKQNYVTLKKMIFLVLVISLTVKAYPQCSINNTVDTWAYPNNVSVGQSFTASCNGVLDYVEVETANSSGNISGTFEVFSGDGLTGSPIYSQNYNLNGTTKVILSSPLNLVSGQMYTFAYSSVAPLGPEYHASNAYSGGKAYAAGSVIGSGEYDWAFDVFISLGLTKLYVDTNVSGGDGSGDSWSNAISDLQTALQNVSSVTTEIWVASGVYKPGVDRSDSFDINLGNLQIYGGFNGTESSINERNITNNPTILSGDLNSDDDTNITYNNTTRSDNSLRVVQINANNVLLDGITISGGYADASSGEGRYGAGLKIADNVGSFTIKKSIIKNNIAWWGSGFSIYSDVDNSNILIDACVFENNLGSHSSSFYATSRAYKTMNFTLVNSLFKNNKTADNTASRKGAGSSAGWIRAYYIYSTINATIVNNTFVNNSNLGTYSWDYPTLGLSQDDGGFSVLTIANNIFWGNTSTYSQVTSIGRVLDANLPNIVPVYNSIDEYNFLYLDPTHLTNTSSANPLFVDAANGDFTLLTGSPAIDTGDNTKVPSGITADLLFNHRIHNTTVDMGCYEFGAASILSVEDNLLESGLKLYPNPVRETLTIRSEQALEKIEVYSMLGAKITTTNKQQLDVSQLANGLYILKIYGEEGGQTTKRFIKQ